jgi:hypothetical protein
MNRLTTYKRAQVVGESRGIRSDLVHVLQLLPRPPNPSGYASEWKQGLPIMFGALKSLH